MKNESTRISDSPKASDQLKEQATTSDIVITKPTGTKEVSPFQWTEGKIAEDDAWFIPWILFLWVNPLLQQATWLFKRGKALEQDDLIPLPPYDHGAPIGTTFEQAWEQQKLSTIITSTAAANKVVDDDKQTKKNTEGHDSKQSNKEGGGAGAGLGSTTRLQKSLLKVMGRRFVTAGFIKAFNTTLQFSFPLLLNNILKFIQEYQRGEITNQDPLGQRYRGYWLAVGLFTAMALKAVTENLYFHYVFRCGYQARVAVSVAVYNKSLRLTNAARQSTTLGELVNLMQVDATKIELLIPQLHVLWDGLLQIIGYMTILYTLIGWPCFAGLFVMVLAVPVQGVIMQKLQRYNSAMVKFTDNRVKLTNEALQGIQSVKMYTWEEAFHNEITKSRTAELTYLRGVAFLRGFSRAYVMSLPGVVAVASFTVYAVGKSNATIDAPTLFAALVAFEQLRFPLMFYPMSLALLAQARVSAARVEAFLGLKELVKDESIAGGIYSRQDECNGQPEIKLMDATIYWNDPSVPITTPTHDTSSAFVSKKSESADDASTDNGSEAPAVRYPKAILQNVSVHIEPGKLCAVIGRVGSGKSTLCSAVLNETILTSGSIALKGRVAYAAQTPWILNASLRDNILFGQPMDEGRYNRVVEACQLTHDFELLENGDLTEIGERGINLSGGQKQRVSVARAAYSDAEIVILDDPLSALDPEVGRRLFDECIVQWMSGRTRLFVTNQLQFIRYCDSIVALKKGTVLEQGTFVDLASNEGGEIKRLMDDLASRQQESIQAGTTNQDKDKTKKSEQAPTTTALSKNKREGDLLTKEERNIGAVSWAIYKKYMLAGGGYGKAGVVVLGFFFAGMNGLTNTIWLSLWTSDPHYKRKSEAFYLGMYFALAVTLGLLTFTRAVAMVRFGVGASSTLHKNLLSAILNAPQSFFDTTPIGRILSRFSKDLYSIDVELTDVLDFFIFGMLQICISFGTILFVTPWFGVALVPLIWFYFHTLQYFRRVSRETKRLDSVSRSPVYAHFSESLGGLVTIRAYGESQRFIDVFEERIDVNTRTYYANKVADRWLSVRLEFVGAATTGLAGIFASNVAIQGSASGKGSDSNFASFAGLSLTLAISVTGLLKEKLFSINKSIHRKYNLQKRIEKTGM